MTHPVRLQLSRRKGFKLQEHSRTTNGLACVAVARPSKWGNRYKPAPAFESASTHFPEMTIGDCVQAHREDLERALATRPRMRDALNELRGFNLACWCSLDRPCHADTLLELANA